MVLALRSSSPELTSGAVFSALDGAARDLGPLVDDGSSRKRFDVLALLTRVTRHSLLTQCASQSAAGGRQVGDAALPTLDLLELAEPGHVQLLVLGPAGGRVRQALQLRRLAAANVTSNHVKRQWRFSSDRMKPPFVHDRITYGSILQPSTGGLWCSDSRATPVTSDWPSATRSRVLVRAAAAKHASIESSYGLGCSST